jgi:predicted DCC family thiol-disulfide oxidoreductase YuxK
MIIIFDGVCNFCNGWVRFVLKRDVERKFVFVAAQSAIGAKLLNQFSLSAVDLQTIVLVDQSKHYEKSDAVLEILLRLGGSLERYSCFLFDPEVTARFSLFGVCTEPL